MTMEALSAMIAGIGLPFANERFRQAQPGPPYICFMFTGSDNFFADGIVYQRIERLNIELYTDDKDPAMEARVRAALDAAELAYQTAETWIESESMYEVVFSTEVDLQESDDGEEEENE